MLALGLFGARFLGLTGRATGRRVLLGVVVNAGGLGCGAFFTFFLHFLLTEFLLGLTDHFFLLLSLSTVGSVSLLLFTVVRVFNNGTRVREELHGDAHSQLQVSHVDTLSRGHTVLDLVYLGLSYVDLQDLRVFGVEKTV